MVNMSVAISNYESVWDTLISLKAFSTFEARSLKRRLLLANSLSKYGECWATVDRYYDGNEAYGRKYAHTFVVLVLLYLEPPYHCVLNWFIFQNSQRINAPILVQSIMKDMGVIDEH